MPNNNLQDLESQLNASVSRLSNLTGSIPSPDYFARNTSYEQKKMSKGAKLFVTALVAGIGFVGAIAATTYQHERESQKRQVIWQQQEQEQQRKQAIEKQKEDSKQVYVMDSRPFVNALEYTTNPQLWKDAQECFRWFYGADRTKFSSMKKGDLPGDSIEYESNPVIYAAISKNTNELSYYVSKVRLVGYEGNFLQLFESIKDKYEFKRIRKHMIPGNSICLDQRLEKTQ